MLTFINKTKKTPQVCTCEKIPCNNPCEKKTLKLRGKLIVYCQFFINVRAKLVCKYFLIKLEANFSHFILILGDNFS
jgi:hypothetical protein